MKVEVFDDAGNNIEDKEEPGELVVTRPHPSLPILWGDTPDGKKLRETYFSHYPGDDLPQNASELPRSDSVKYRNLSTRRFLSR